MLQYTQKINYPCNSKKDFCIFYELHSKLLHLPPLALDCVGRCCETPFFTVLNGLSHEKGLNNFDKNLQN
jgi:hypothetical protein